MIENKAMAFRLEHLHRAFAAENELAFAAWAYATRDPIAAVTAKGYFHGCHRQLTVGDLIFCAVAQPPPRAPDEAGRERQRCLLLVTRMDWDGIETRLAQDWGTADHAPAPAPAITATAPAQAPSRKRQPRISGRADVAGCGQRPPRLAGGARRGRGCRRGGVR